MSAILKKNSLHPYWERGNKLNPKTQKHFLKQSQICRELQMLFLESRTINILPGLSKEKAFKLLLLKWKYCTAWTASDDILKWKHYKIEITRISRKGNWDAKA